VSSVEYFDHGEQDTLHVMPLPTFPGEREHDCSSRCWCEPVQDGVEPRLWVHHRRAAS